MKDTPIWVWALAALGALGWWNLRGRGVPLAAALNPFDQQFVFYEGINALTGELMPADEKRADTALAQMAEADRPRTAPRRIRRFRRLRHRHLTRT